MLIIILVSGLYLLFWWVKVSKLYFKRKSKFVHKSYIAVKPFVAGLFVCEIHLYSTLCIHFRIQRLRDHVTNLLSSKLQLLKVLSVHCLPFCSSIPNCIITFLFKQRWLDRPRYWALPELPPKYKSKGILFVFSGDLKFILLY